MPRSAFACGARMVGVATTAVGVAAAMPAAYVAVLTAAGARPAGPPVPGRGETRFAILVPAHDEAEVIADTLAALAAVDYPADRMEVHVVADNCRDRTAEIARRFPCTVHERTDPDEPGKGPALNWVTDRIAGRAHDAIAIVDADTIVAPDFLRAMDAALESGAVVAQGHYTVREPEASPATSLRYAALASRHHLRPLGRARLGGSCGLYGNGMVFRREVLETRRWSGHLVEDAEMQLELLLDGRRVVYVPDAVVRAEMPVTFDQADSQNRRWERGRLEMARRYLAPLVRRVVRPTGVSRRAALDTALDQVTPPLSVLVVGHAATAAAAGLGAVAGSRSARRVFVVHVLCSVAVVAHVLVGLASVSASRRHYRALVAAPGAVWWKLRLWSDVLRGGDQVEWTRTQRNAVQEVRA